MRQVLVIGMVLATAMAAGGCTAGRYRSQPLGPVPYDMAFREARTVFCQYFSVAEADEAKGRIVGRVKLVDTGTRRLLGPGPGREKATMRIRQKGSDVIAEVRVEVERQDIAAVRALQPVTVYDELPTQSPVLESGALTAEQDQAWASAGRNEAVERAILRDLLDRIAACRQPTP
ncbi:MAG TPA: hypothetical protein VFJ30_14750 [Phycisphaerae bacterium]|nr:hypothetical protein [Phycisphaerae bacterium]